MIPINVDRNVGPAAYRPLVEQKQLLVTSMFYTFQGEGPYAGRPALFLRMAGCNLGDKTWCPWCDTRFNFDEGHALSVRGLASSIDAELTKRVEPEVIVVTGGEPLLQWPMLRELIAAMTVDRPYLVWQFETNGVLLTKEMLDDVERHSVRFVVSPKMIGGRYQALPIVDWADALRWGRISLKYVVSADQKSPYHHLPEHFNWKNSRIPRVGIYLSGQTEYGPQDPSTRPGAPVSLGDLDPVALAQTLRNNAYAAKLALQHGCRVSFQTQLLAGVE